MNLNSLVSMLKSGGGGWVGLQESRQREDGKDWATLLKDRCPLTEVYPQLQYSKYN